MEKGNKSYHFFDRYIGVPSIFLLSLFKNRFRKKPLIVNRIGIVNLFSIGDNVLMSAVIRDMMAKYQNAEFIAFVANNNYQLVKLIPGFSQIYKLPIANPFKTIGILKKERRFDLIIDFGSWPRVSALYSFFIKSNYTIGFNAKGQYRHYLFDETVVYSHDIHEIDNYRALIKPFYDTPFNHLPFIGYTATDKSKSLSSEVGRYCIIHPWPGGNKSFMKQWENEKWIELIYRISEYFETIILTGAPSDDDKCSEFEKMIDPSKMKCKFRNISGMLSLGETAYLLKQANFIVSIDTGIAHMAAAFNKPLICIQGPASSVRWRPYSDNAVAINPDRGTFGYLSFGFEYYRAKGNCMENISVDKVYSVFKGMYNNDKE